MTHKMIHKTAENIKGSAICIKSLENQGVDVMFAYPGGYSMELHQALQQSSIRVILPRNEQGGAFAAAGYARATGKVGVCMATSGPGATNLITGIADAYLDSIPCVFITGQVPSKLIGKSVFQETDMIGMTRPIVKHSYLVLDAKDLPSIMEEAFYLAASGRPGPIVIDIPKDVQQQLVEKFDFTAHMNIRAYNPSPKISTKDLNRIIKAIKSSKRPCVYAGGGIISANASKELRKFVDKWNIPIVSTLMGLGAIPSGHELYLSWLGMHGAACANYAANEADLLLAFGARFDDRVTGVPENFASKAKIVHVDIDISEINKNKFADIGIVADIKDTLKKLNAKAEYAERPQWLKQIREWKEKFSFSYKKRDDIIQAQYVMERLCDLTKGEAVIVPGVGQHQMWAGQFYKHKHPRHHITSGGLGTMGFGLPSAMGVKVACPEKTVINIDGDGSFQMNIQELGTIHSEDIDVKMVIMNNQHLGMVAQWEDRFYGSVRGNTEMGNKRVQRPYPDFVSIAKGYGIPGREVYTLDELEDALEEMLNSKEAFLLDIHTGYEEHVLPMIPPGKTYKDIIFE